jgi:hypothetical protein
MGLLELPFPTNWTFPANAGKEENNPTATARHK